MSSRPPGRYNSPTTYESRLKFVIFHWFFLLGRDDGARTNGDILPVISGASRLTVLLRSHAMSR